MSFVAIIGAGELGGALAQTLARRDRVAEIRLIDAAAGVAAGKALDIQQAGPIEGFRTVLRSSGEYAAAAGAAVIVLADPIGTVSPRLTPALSPGGEEGRREEEDTALATLERLAAVDERAVCLCAGAAHRALVERAVRELKIDRRRVLGSAPGALAAALRAMVALEARASPADVSLALLGVPPAHAVVPWSAAAIGGVHVAAVLAPPAITRLNARLPRLWPPGPYALASAAARVVEAIITQSDRRFSCFVTLDGEMGVRGRTTAVPVMLGPTGVRNVLTPALNTRERVQLENALASVTD